MFFKSVTKLHRLLLLAVAGMIGIVYFVPIWIITLDAPQYPEGLSMTIWIDKLNGGTRFDLQNINLLNKYIGMAAIDQTTIPELQYMPYIAAGMIALALVSFIIPKLILVITTAVSYVVISLVGFVDFFLWEYEYGHNLNPDAPIIVPGMTYQPPLIGCKELLNITACSFPHIGGVLLATAIGILFYIIWVERKKWQAEAVS